MLKIFKEAKVNVRLSTPEPRVDISVPSPQSPNGRVQLSCECSSFDATVIQDEDTFATEFLAAQGSIYFRKCNQYPRCILWRVVKGNRHLELRSVDLTKGIHESQEAVITLRFEFPDVIIPHGVALADREDHGTLDIFVITAARQLYTLELRSFFFLDGSQIDQNVANWCKFYRPTPLSFTHPHRLHAASALELLISLHSGALLRLTRKSGDDGSSWSLITLDERPWGASLRGLVKWRNSNSIQYDGKFLDPNTPTAIVTTSDQAFAFIVGLNHSLRVWNLASHRLVASKDLLNRKTPQRDILPGTLNPSEHAFIRVISAERALRGSMYYLITYSPYDDGQFKFWAVKGSLTGQLEIEDLFPDAKYKAVDPDPSGSLFWTVVDFEITSTDQGRNMMLWVLWKSNTFYQLYCIRFDLLDLPNVWSKNWTRMALELHAELPPTLLQPVMADPTDDWLEFIFTPGKYPPAVLGAALATFSQSIQRHGVQRFPEELDYLQQRIFYAIQNSVTLRKSPGETIDFSRYCKDLDAGWRQFWHIAEGLNKRRFETISLAYDHHSKLPWVLFTDACASVRECSSTEILFHNEASVVHSSLHLVERDWLHRNLVFELGDHPDESARLISLAASFRKTLTPELIRTCRTALNTELFMESSLSATERLIAFHKRCGLADLLTDSMHAIVYTNIKNSIGLGRLCTDIFFAIIASIPPGFSGKDSGLLSTKFGRAVTMGGTTESICLTKQIFYDLLLLTVFIEIELNSEEIVEFNGPELFVTLIRLLREYEVLNWLVSKTRVSLGICINNGVSDTKPATMSKVHLSRPPERRASILEDLFAIHIKPRAAVDVSQMYTLTQQIRDVVSWTTRQGEVSLENVSVFVQCDLIARGNIDLATDFLRFQPDSGWSTYVKGRLYLAKDDFDAAATNFQRASYMLSYGKPIGDLQEMSSKLIDVVSTNSFYNGLANYFLHIMGLFDQYRSSTPVAHYAILSLHAAETNTSKVEQNPDLQLDVLSHLFHAHLKTYHFEEAYITLSKHPDPAYRQSAFTSLLAAIITRCGSSTGSFEKILQISLSLGPGICFQLDEILASFSQKQTCADLRFNKANLTASSEYLSTLKAILIARNDLEGAAKVSYRKLCQLRDARNDHCNSARNHALGTTNRTSEEDGKIFESVELLNELLSLINLLVMMENNDAYILVDEAQFTCRNDDGAKSADNYSTPNSLTYGPTISRKPLTTNPDGSSFSVANSESAALMLDATKSEVRSGRVGSGWSTGELRSKQDPTSRFIVLTLDDLRHEYQLELDKTCRIQNGDWEYGEL
ncbi:hypothetical protein PRK78_007122 [Emydomyces testavorans]|uniref:Nucleoporin Nup120/160-domain-containing protein n=1 Tax=Emydomyces testavorans TaxID=2070801 RepID=A0AAF0IMD2_9EURO|nr:hypothetical protein PRK78_007122 [Emydomyces testavorans]